MDACASGCMKALITILFVLALVSITVQSLRIEADVKGVISGGTSWVNVSAGSIQKAAVFWQNTGSSGCMARARTDFFAENTSDIAYSAWSSEKPLAPSEESEFDMMSLLPPGRYSAFIRFYQCNEIIRKGPYEVIVASSPKEGSIEILGVTTYTDRAVVFVSSREEAGDIYVIPERYPTGWMFESGKITGMYPGDTGFAVLGYDPGLWRESNVTFAAVTGDGRFVSRATFLLKRQSDIPMIAVAIPGVAILFVLLLASKRFF